MNFQVVFLKQAPLNRGFVFFRDIIIVEGFVKHFFGNTIVLLRKNKKNDMKIA